MGVEGAEIVALADPDAEGRRRHAELTGAPAAYADYREMLAAEKPDIAVIATHEMSGHLQMVLAAGPPPAPTSTWRSRSPRRSARWTGCWTPATGPACCW